MKTLSGEYPELLGKAKAKKGKNIFQKIGKITSPITTRLAKVAAGIVGIPPNLIDSLAKVDPTAAKKLQTSLVASKAGQQAAAIIDTGPVTTLKNIKPVYIAGAAAGVLAIVFLTMKKKKKA
jgi:hypothetical protein